MYAQEHFNYQRKKLGIARGLEMIGETRFGSIYWSGESVLRGFPALRAIVADKALQIDLPV
jgi:hypothetical protein